MDAFNPTPVWQMYNLPAPSSGGGGGAVIPAIGGMESPGLMPKIGGGLEGAQQKLGDAGDVATRLGAKDLGSSLTGASDALSKKGIISKVMGIVGL